MNRRKTLEKVEKKNLSDSRPTGKIFDRGKSFRVGNLRDPVNTEKEKIAENVGKSPPCVISPEILQEKRMKYGNLSDAWSLKNNSNDTVLDNTDSVGEKLSVSG